MAVIIHTYLTTITAKCPITQFYTYPASYSKSVFWPGTISECMCPTIISVSPYEKYSIVNSPSPFAIRYTKGGVT